jgi:hypothetical protein
LKKTTFAPVPYTPGPPPADLPASAQRYLDDELNRISGLLQILMSVVQSGTSISLAPTPGAPAAATMSEIRYTDGTTWDPGSGEGYYYFNSHGVWTPLG